MATLAPATRRRIRVAVDLLGLPKDRVVRRAARVGLRPVVPAGRQRALVLPPYAPGSLGDEALVEGTLGELRRRGWEPAIIEYRRERRWGPLKDCPSLDLSAFFHLDRRIAPLSRADLARFKAALPGYDRFVMIGADVLDGYYNPSRTMLRLLLADMAARSGLPTSVISCSFNAIPTRRAALAMRALPPSVRFAVRDEISLARTERLLGRPCELAADVAFLMTPDGAAPQVAVVAEWAARQRAQGRLVIGTNLNLDPFEFAGSGTPEQAVAVHLATLRALFEDEPGASFLYMSHDWRGDPSEEQLAERVLAGLTGAEREHVHLARGPYGAREAKGIVAQVDFLVTGRMHLSIGAISQTVPIAVLPYQDKFDGLMRHLRLDDVLLDVPRALSEGTLAPQVRPLIERRGEIRARLEAELPRVLALSRSNLD